MAERDGAEELGRDSRGREQERARILSDRRSRDAWDAEREGMEGKAAWPRSFHPARPLGPGALSSTLRANTWQRGVPQFPRGGAPLHPRPSPPLPFFLSFLFGALVAQPRALRN